LNQLTDKRQANRLTNLVSQRSAILSISKAVAEHRLPIVATVLARFLACLSCRLAVFNCPTEECQPDRRTNLVPQRSTVLSVSKAVAEPFLPIVATGLASFLACFSDRLTVFNRSIEERQANYRTNLVPQRSAVLSVAKAVAARLLPIIPTGLARFAA
jgi:hypothetical protein